MSLLFLPDGSQANKVVCRGTVDDLTLALVTLATAAAVDATPPPKKKHTFVSPSSPFDPLCHLTGDKFLLKARFKPFFRHKTTSQV